MFSFSFAGEVFPAIAEAALTSVIIAAVSFTLAAILGLPLVLLTRSQWKWLSSGTAVGIDFVRCTPLLIQLFFFYFALPEFGFALSPTTTGVAVLSIHFGCYMSEVYRAGLESVERGQWEACSALGLSKWHAYRLVILPLAIRPVIPAAGTYLVHLFKETPLLAAISVPEMMFVSSQIGSDQFRYFEPITICGFLFLTMSLVASFLIGLFERRYRLN